MGKTLATTIIWVFLFLSPSHALENNIPNKDNHFINATTTEKITIAFKKAKTYRHSRWFHGRQTPVELTIVGPVFQNADEQKSPAFQKLTETLKLIALDPMVLDKAVGLDISSKFSRIILKPYKEGTKEADRYKKAFQNRKNDQRLLNESLSTKHEAPGAEISIGYDQDDLKQNKYTLTGYKTIKDKNLPRHSAWYNLVRKESDGLNRQQIFKSIAAAIMLSIPQYISLDYQKGFRKSEIKLVYKNYEKEYAGRIYRTEDYYKEQQIQKIKISNKKQIQQEFIDLWQKSVKSVKIPKQLGEITAVAFSPDGKSFLSGSKDKVIILWDLKTGEKIRTLISHKSEVTAVAFSPDGRFALSGDANGKRLLWNISMGTVKMINSTGCYGAVTSLDFHPGGKYAITGCSGTFLEIWDLKSNRTDRIIGEQLRAFDYGSFSPNGELILVNKYGQTSLIDPTSKKVIRKFNPPLPHVSPNRPGSYWPVSALAFHPSSQLFLAGNIGKKFNLHLWDINSVDKIRSFIGHRKAVTSAVFSPDGNTILSGSLDKTLILWDVETGKILRTFREHEAGITSAVLSPDGKTALSASEDSIKHWNVDSGELIRTFGGNTFKDKHKSVVLVPDNQPGLKDNKKPRQIILDEMVNELEGVEKDILSTSISSDGSILLTGTKDATINLWHIKTKTLLRTFKAHYKGVRSVAISPDNQMVLSLGKDEWIKLWDVESGEAIIAFPVERKARAVKFSQDGRSFWVRYIEKAVRYPLLDINTLYSDYVKNLDQNDKEDLGRLDKRWRLLHTSPVPLEDIKLLRFLFNQPENRASGVSKLFGFFFNQSENQASAVSELAAIMKLTPPDPLDLLTATEVYGFKVNTLPGAYKSFEFSGNLVHIKSDLYSSGQKDIFLTSPLKETGFEIIEKKLEPAKNITLEEHGKQISSILFSPDQKTALGVGGDAKLWELKTGRIIREFKLDNSSKKIAFSPDGKSVLIGKYHLELATGKLLGKDRRYRLGHGFTYFHPDGKTVLSSMQRTKMDLWNFETKTDIKSFPSLSKSGYIGDASISPDGKTILSGGSSSLLGLWDIKTRNILREYHGHTKPVSLVKFSPDGKTALSGSWDKTIKLWDIDTGQVTRTFQSPDYISQVAFNPDGKTALIGSRMNSYYLWNLSSGKVTNCLKGDRQRITAMVFSPDGKSILTAGKDKSLKLWQTGGPDFCELPSLGLALSEKTRTKPKIVPAAKKHSNIEK